MRKRGGNFVDATHASLYLGVSRGWFYQQYRPYLRYYRFGKLRRKYYAIADLEALRDSEEVVEPAA